MSLGDFFRANAQSPGTQAAKEEAPRKPPRMQNQKPAATDGGDQNQKQSRSKPSWTPLFQSPAPKTNGGSTAIAELDEEVARFRREKEQRNAARLHEAARRAARAMEAAVMPRREELDPSIWSSLPEDLVRSVLTCLPVHARMGMRGKAHATVYSPSFAAIDCAIPLTGSALRRNQIELGTDHHGCRRKPVRYDLVNDFVQWENAVLGAAARGDAVLVKRCLRATVAQHLATNSWMRHQQ